MDTAAVVGTPGQMPQGSQGAGTPITGSVPPAGSASTATAANEGSGAPASEGPAGVGPSSPTLAGGAARGASASPGPASGPGAPTAPLQRAGGAAGGPQQTPASRPSQPAPGLREPLAQDPRQAAHGPLGAVQPGSGRLAATPSAASAAPEGGSGTTATGAPAPGSAAASSPAPPSPSPFSAPGAGVGPAGHALQQQIDELRATIDLALRRGSAQARLTLSPPALGSLRVNLSQTPGGLVARVSADSAAGAQALISGQADLRASLGSLGIALLHLDIGGRGHQQALGGRRPRARSAADPLEAAASAEPAAETEAVHSTLAGGQPRAIDIVV
jgi:flagellar hook-length control protein FliK